MYHQIIDTNVAFNTKRDSSSGQDQTQLDSASESKKNEQITSDADPCLFHVVIGHASGLC